MCRQSHRTSTAGAGAVAEARAWVHEQVEAHYPAAGALDADVELVVSELATNAVRAGTAWLQVSVQAEADVVRVAVADSAPGRPQRRDARGDAVTGRGLAIVAVLAADWGVAGLPDGAGKQVWADVSVPAEAVGSFACRHRRAAG